jgi:hypothetical protein
MVTPGCGFCEKGFWQRAVERTFAYPIPHQRTLRKAGLRKAAGVFAFLLGRVERLFSNNKNKAARSALLFRRIGIAGKRRNRLCSVAINGGRG